MADKNGNSQADDTVASSESLWPRFLAAAAAALRSGWDALEGVAPTPEDKEKLARLLREVFDRAIEVPPGLYEKIKADVERRPAAERADPVAASWNRTRGCALRTAGVGAVTTIPAAAPSVGPAIAALGLVADWRYVAEQQRNLVLEIAALFGAELEDPSREVRLLFLLSTGVAWGDTAVGALVGKQLARSAGQELSRRALARMAPVAGAAVAGSLNYTASLALGRAAITRFAREARIKISEKRWAQEHPALDDLRESVIAAMAVAEKGQVPTPVIAPELASAIAELSPPEREELLGLAAVCAGFAEDLSREQQETLTQIAAALGFSDSDVARKRARFRRRFAARARRIARLLQEAAAAVRSGSGNAWTRSFEFTRTAWNRVARRAARARSDAASGEVGEDGEDAPGVQHGDAPEVPGTSA